MARNEQRGLSSFRHADDGEARRIHLRLLAKPVQGGLEEFEGDKGQLCSLPRSTEEGDRKNRIAFSMKRSRIAIYLLVQAAFTAADDKDAWSWIA